MKQAEKFRRPIVSFVDVVGAYPGVEAEERGQGLAIAGNILEMTKLSTSIIVVITGGRREWRRSCHRSGRQVDNAGERLFLRNFS